MRILQIIDSLEAGGAERMAVSYANALAEQIDFSGLVVSRKEGPLLNQVNKKVSYVFLEKKSAFDLRALFRLRRFVKANKVTWVQAHSTSFFLAFLLKLSCPNIRLIWHDHYGDSEFLSKRPLFFLKIAIPFFEGIIAVNQKLKLWSEQSLNFKNTIYLPNFPVLEKEGSQRTILKGMDGKRIVSLANLRIQKDHFLLLEVAKKLKISHPEWTFHLVGKDFGDDYSKEIKKLIIEYNLENNVFIYGTKQDVKNILKQASIAVLTSQSEGLPVALLEYGWHKKPVVVTRVGEIPLLVEDGENGFMVAAHEPILFYDSLVKLIENDVLKDRFGEALYKTISRNNSEDFVMEQYLNWLKSIKK